MILSDEQKNALSELIDIAFSRTAATLSDLTGHRAGMNFTEVAVRRIEEPPEAPSPFANGELASVHQIFSGPVSGDAILLLDHEEAKRLIGLLTGETSGGGPISASGQEILTEVGNILLNAFLGMFVTPLNIDITFSVPRLCIGSLDPRHARSIVDQKEPRYALESDTIFHLHENTVTGHLLIVLGAASLGRLIEALEEAAKRPSP